MFVHLCLCLKSCLTSSSRKRICSFDMFTQILANININWKKPLQTKEVELPLPLLLFLKTEIAKYALLL